MPFEIFGFLALRGCVAVEWDAMQDLHSTMVVPTMQAYPPPWGPTIVQQLVSFGLSVWCHRNKRLHGVSLTEQAEILRKHVRSKVEDLYAENPRLHPRFPGIRAIPLDIRLTYGTCTLQAWLRQVAHQKIWMQKRRDSELLSQRSI